MGTRRCIGEFVTALMLNDISWLPATEVYIGTGPLTIYRDVHIWSMILMTEYADTAPMLTLEMGTRRYYLA